MKRSSSGDWPLRSWGPEQPRTQMASSAGRAGRVPRLGRWGRWYASRGSSSPTHTLTHVPGRLTRFSVSPEVRPERRLGRYNVRRGRHLRPQVCFLCTTVGPSPRTLGFRGLPYNVTRVIEKIRKVGVGLPTSA